MAETDELPEIRGDIPAELARAAHQGTSWTPDERGRQERDAYAIQLSADYQALLKLAPTEPKRATLDGEFARYREGYAARYRRWLASRSRIVSWLIAGRSNFPLDRMQKRSQIADRRYAELVEFRLRALKAIRRDLQPERRPIMAGDADAQERLRTRIAKAEQSQARMKAVNAAIRRYAKAGRDAQLAALFRLWPALTPNAACKLLEPDFCGRIGFPDYLLRNNNAKIRRLKQRLAAIERDQAAHTTEAEGVSGIRMEDAPADNRVRLFFPGKPDQSVRTLLKRSGFRWAPSIGCWQAYRNPASIRLAQSMAESRPDATGAMSAAEHDGQLQEVSGDGGQGHGR